ncbi:UNVERIFIED_CONTAM: hypothetical protein FKN15_035631 [Acipenser sinensis]
MQHPEVSSTFNPQGVGQQMPGTPWLSQGYAQTPQAIPEPEEVSTTAPAHNPGRGSSAGQCGPLPLAPGHPAGLPRPPCAGPGAQESATLATALPLVPCSALPEHPDVAGLLPDVAGAPRSLLRSPWVIGHRCAGPQVKTSARCCILLFPGRRFSRPCHPGGVPCRRFTVPSWKHRRDRPILKPARVRGRKLTFVDSRVNCAIRALSSTVFSNFEY